MNLHIQRLPEGHLELWIGNRPILRRLDVEVLPASLDATIEASPWDAVGTIGKSESRQTLRRRVTRNGDVAWIEEIVVENDHAKFSVELMQPLHNLQTDDSFESFSTCLPRMIPAEGLRFFLTTHGLGPSGNGAPGGYWPEAMLIDSPDEFPREAFAPLVLFDQDCALAIAPTSQYLTSTLLGREGAVIRSLHGSIDELPAGTHIETVLVAARDVASALLRTGDLLLARSGKTRPDPRNYVMTSKLGWWNAYGGYYTEPIHPLNAPALEAMLESLRQQDAPVEYLGLDLWYPYKYIGQALLFSPDRTKYPDGVGNIARRFGMPTVLHLSALSNENEYGADGADPSFYHQVADALSVEDAQVAWHDWLRTQQHLTPALRSDIERADSWFRGMSSAMDERGISVMTCMQTMGMILESTELPNVIAARSSIDYLFAQQEALSTLEKLGQPDFRNEETSLSSMRRQNLLVGLTYYALGLLPFYDLFLTQWQEGVGGLSPKAEAVLRSLSCGPIGIGDGPGMSDVDLLSFLISSDGRLLQPDHPPYPDTSTLGQPIEIYRTERRTGDLSWEYVLALNTTNVDQSFDLPMDPSRICWDIMQETVVQAMKGTLPAGEIACFLLAPMREEIAPLGLWRKSAPASTTSIVRAHWDGTWHIEIDVSNEVFAVWSSRPVVAFGEEGHPLQTQVQGPLTCIEVGEGVSSLSLARR